MQISASSISAMRVAIASCLLQHGGAAAAHCYKALRARESTGKHNRLLNASCLSQNSTLASSPVLRSLHFDIFFSYGEYTYTSSYHVEQRRKQAAKAHYYINYNAAKHGRKIYATNLFPSRVNRQASS